MVMDEASDASTLDEESVKPCILDRLRASLNDILNFSIFSFLQ